jgi:anaerobic selenocysteine-containing dehydrogenase
MTTTHPRTCHICEANCGILVELDGRRVVSIKGDPDHVLSRGHICPKATALADLESDPDRLRAPVKRTAKGWETIGWDQAYGEIAARLAALKGCPALYIGNPTAHNYGVSLQTKHLKKALGVRAIYSASTLDQIPHQLVQMWMYGHNALFPIPDIDRTRLMLIVGGNPMASNGSVWTVPNFRNRVKALQARGGQLVVVDPRRTETADIADRHHFIRPGTDAAFFLALLKSLDEAGLVTPGRLAAMLDDGWGAAWNAIRSFEVDELAAHCGIAASDIRALAADLAAGPACLYGRMGVSVQGFGTLNHWLIQLVNIATGNLDREGGPMFSSPVIDLAGSSGPGSYDRFRSRIGNHPEVLSEFPVATLAEEITTPGDGQVRALVTVAGNPVLSSPGGERLDAALATLDTMVAIDMYVTATSRHAHYILPPCGPLQKDHYPLVLGPIAVRNYACYSPPTLPMDAGAKADWEIVAELARAIAGAKGETLPNIRSPREALDAMLRASRYPGLSLAGLEANPHGLDFGPHVPRLPERLGTPDKRIQCAPPLCLAELARFRAAMMETPSGALRLIGRRHVRNNNSWLHNSPRLLKGPERCTLMIHPADATARFIEDGQEVTVTSRVGEVALPAEVTDAVMPGVVSMPHGFGHGRDGVQLTVASARPGVSLNDLTDPDALDPVSGNAVLNGTPVVVAPVPLVAAAE